jgi:5-formyltetrahydrofolate cyclo-ligase
LNKQDLRMQLQETRDSIPKTEKEKMDAAVAAHLLSWEIYRSSKVLFCFVSFRSEINTFPIIEQSLKLGKEISVPKINLSTGEMHAYIIEDLNSSLEPGHYGILEPVTTCRELDYHRLELIITPGLAFTLHGERLGYGGGFYDRFMGCHKQAISCALTYNRLILSELPVKEHDLAVDYVITESGVKPALQEDQ